MPLLEGVLGKPGSYERGGGTPGSLEPEGGVQANVGGRAFGSHWPLPRIFPRVLLK